MKKLLLIICLFVSAAAVGQDFNLKVSGSLLILTDTGSDQVLIASPLVSTGYYVKTVKNVDRIFIYQNQITRHIGIRDGYEISNIENDITQTPFTTNTITEFFNTTLAPANFPAVTVNNEPFRLTKGQANKNAAKKTELEVNDYVSNGFFDSSTFWLAAVYLGGDVNLETSFLVIAQIEN